MKKIGKLFTVMLAAMFAVIALVCVGCDGADTKKPSTPGGGTDKPSVQAVDYAGETKLDMSSESKKQEVTVRQYVDGDTTHFNPVTNSTITSYNEADFTKTDGYIKARYIAINTPENTGHIEEWGEAAAKFTRGKLEGAESIIVESDDGIWNIDSSGSNRYVVWVWYKTKGAADYRNLNIEILQEGLAFGSSVSNNRYGKTAFAALGQAQELKKYVFSGEKDPDYPYGEATPVSLRELRCNIETYLGKKVKVEGVVTADVSNCVYIEDYDAETERSFGMQVYYGYETGELLEILAIGNRVKIVGVLVYYEAGDTYQISDVKFDLFHPDDPANTTLISAGNTVPFTEIGAADLIGGKANVQWEVETEDEDGKITVETVKKELDFGAAVMNTSVTLKNLTITDVYTTKKGNSQGAMSITCLAADKTTVTVRTEVLYDENNNLIDESAFPVGSVIDVKGLVDKYDGAYQVRVYRDDYIIIHS